MPGVSISFFPHKAQKVDTTYSNGKLFFSSSLNTGEKIHPRFCTSFAAFEKAGVFAAIDPWPTSRQKIFNSAQSTGSGRRMWPVLGCGKWTPVVLANPTFLLSGSSSKKAESRPNELPELDLVPTYFITFFLRPPSPPPF